MANLHGEQQTESNVFQFPLRKRLAARGPRTIDLLEEVRAYPACDAASGDGWYHLAAIKDGERGSHS
ncbi:DUF2735 domain-containing protein [Aurantimonas sp. Leaf443]|uniref:DUF2735 domain-containing protein n=1 Tax=Aurantimonas sp. Leaf443 TaxID=1736378 RepID=UPI0006F83D00|nr:DUF2735 domain-containing protein [Aurantimonas sp. Leaf443]KQT83514.1 hypothetical protein ASG48_13285 [Aurantimonas sp. Leaf443]